MKKILITIGYFAIGLMFCSNMQAQSFTPPAPNNIVPPSPTAASLGKYGAIPVSTYTGVPNINIPIYTIQGGSISLPLSLSYHASGIRVSEEASWVGLGWSFLSGGAVTRAIRGLDDFTYNAGYPDYTIPLAVNEFNEYVPGSATPWNELYFLRDVYSQVKDPEPDIFYYNFAGHSGKFTIAQRPNLNAPYQFNIESQEKIKIELMQEGGDKFWLFTAEDGKKYLFKTPEKSKTYSNSAVNGEYSPDRIFSDQDPKTSISTWYLDQIVSPDGHAIEFEYTLPSSNGSVPVASRSESRSHLKSTVIHNNGGCSPESNPNNHIYYTSHSVVYDVYLKKIIWNNGQVVFETSDRQDIRPFSNGPLPQKLDKIHIYKRSGQEFEEIKSFDLTYDYFINNDAHLDYSSGTYQYTYSKAFSGKRLKLLGIKERSGSIELPQTSFEYITNNYHSGTIMDKYTKAQDHWGYFNDKPNTTVPDQYSPGNFVSTLLPAYVEHGTGTYYGGADKTPDVVAVQLGSLKKITYPTGGSTEFRYGINEYGNFPPENVTELHYEMAQAYGENVDPLLEPIISDPYMPSTIQISLPTSTLLSFRVTAGYDWNFNCVGWGGDGSMMIRSTGTTPFFQRTILPNLQCWGYFDVYQEIIVPPGTYEVKVTATVKVINQVLVSWQKQSQVHLLSKPGGGLRVESIIDFDGLDHNNDVITEYKYTHQVGESERSSGVLMSPVFNEYLYQQYKTQVCGKDIGGNDLFVSFTGTYLNRTTESAVPLGVSAQGKTIGYSTVTVLHGANGVNGKTVFTYKNEPELLPAYFFPTLPNTPNPSNGLLLSQLDYKYDVNLLPDDPFRKVRSLTREYVNETDSRKVTKGLKCRGCEFITENIGGGIPPIPQVQFYDNVSEWWHLSSETTTEYSVHDENVALVSNTEYFYENPVHLQLTKTINTASNGKIITAFKYPLDYANITSMDEVSSGISELSAAHVINPVIEKSVYRSDLNGSNERLISSVFNTYAGLKLKKVFLTELSTPVTNFMRSIVEQGAVVKDNRYSPRLIYDQYTEQGKPMQMHKPGDIKQSFLWDHTSTYPVAEVKNAEVNDIAFTSFELYDSYYSWGVLVPPHSTNSFTGKHSHSLADGAVVKSGLTSSRKYIVTYWTTSASSLAIAGTQGTPARGATINGWTFFKHIVTGQQTVSVSGNGNIDELRLYPEGALMTTYNYEPLVGMTSQGDVNGRIIFYEYDGLGRLLRIRDQDNHILKLYDYKYRQ